MLASPLPPHSRQHPARVPGLPFLALGLPSLQGDGRLKQSCSCPRHTLPAPSPDPLLVPLLSGAHLPASPLRARLEPPGSVPVLGTGSHHSVTFSQTWVSS